MDALKSMLPNLCAQVLIFKRFRGYLCNVAMLFFGAFYMQGMHPN